MAFILYLDRVCLGEIVKSDSFLDDVKLSKLEIGRILGAFFFTYALCQVPSGWFSDRFGARRMLTLYILTWSLLTAASGWMSTFSGLLMARLAFGIAQAGAYPTSGGLVRRWIRLEHRGRASSLVCFGGRLGATLAPFLTTSLIVYLGGWRPTLWAYGLMGILVATAYWWIARDRPADHPACNAAERNWIGQPPDDHQTSLAELVPLLRACVTSPSLWLNSLEQFCVNIGWAYLITWLPTYLKETRGVEAQTGALMVTFVLSLGMVGQLIGGWATDWTTRRFGLRLGRILPICISCLIASGAYLGCWKFQSLGAVLLCCGLVSLMTDVGNPSIWAFMQDIGGRSTGAVYGWANMWGNLGAAVSSVLVPWLLKMGEETGTGQSLVFITFAGSFFIASMASLGMNATRSLDTGAPARRMVH